MCGAGGPQTEERGARAPRLTRMEGQQAAPDQHPPTATDLGGGAAGLAWGREGRPPAHRRGGERGQPHLQGLCRKLSVAGGHLLLVVSRVTTGLSFLPIVDRKHLFT